MYNFIKLLIEGTISNFLPTLLGAFLGFFLGITYNRYRELSAYKKQLTLSFVEITININQIKSLVNFINSVKETPKIYTSKNFLELNLWNNPIHSSLILDLKFLSEISDLNLAANFYQNVKNSEILYNSIKYGIFTDYESLIKSINSLIEFYCKIAWSIYQISSGNNLEFNNNNYNTLVEKINKSDKSKLKLNKIAM
jgi:hypothetical protein